MDVNLSYALSLQVKNRVGSSPKANTEELTTFLEQAEGAIVSNAKTFKITTQLGVGSAGEIQYDLRQMGINQVRVLLVKSTKSIRVELEDQTLFGAMLFSDYGLIIPTAPRTVPYPLTLHNPNSAVCEVKLIVVGI